MERKRSTRILLYAFMVIVALLTLLPLAWAIASSFSTDSEIFRNASPISLRAFFPKDFNLDAYKGLFTEYQFHVPMINTLVVSILTILLGCLINSAAAFGFAMFDFKFKKILYGVVLLSFMVPFESIAIPLFNVVNGLGWVDTFQGIITPTIADGLVLMLFTQFFKDIPPSLLEAARVDGAKFSTIFFRIIIPLSKPVFITAGLMVFMNSWNAFLWPLIVASRPELRMVQVALAMFQTERATLWSYLFAASTISAIIPLLLFLPFQRYYVEGITSAGIKG